jgi:hypothetical protein
MAQFIQPQGWNTWDIDNLNMLAHVPACLVARFDLFDPHSGEVREHFGPYDVRFGARGSHYGQLNFIWRGRVVGFEFAFAGDFLACRFTPDDSAADLLLKPNFTGAWGQPIQDMPQRWQMRASRVEIAAHELHYTLDAPLMFILSFDEALTPADGEALIAQQQPPISDSAQDSRNWSRLLAFLGVQTQPWNGWDFGLVELTEIVIPEGLLNIMNLTSGLRVDLNQQWLVAADQPAHIYDFVMAGRTCHFGLRALQEVEQIALAVGLLPPHTQINIDAGGQQWSVATDGAGVLQLAGLQSTRIHLTW